MDNKSLCVCSLQQSSGKKKEEEDDEKEETVNSSAESAHLWMNKRVTLMGKPSTVMNSQLRSKGYEDCWQIL